MRHWRAIAVLVALLGLVAGPADAKQRKRKKRRAPATTAEASPPQAEGRDHQSGAGGPENASGTQVAARRGASGGTRDRLQLFGFPFFVGGGIGGGFALQRGGMNTFLLRLNSGLDLYELSERALIQAGLTTGLGYGARSDQVTTRLHTITTTTAQTILDAFAWSRFLYNVAPRLDVFGELGLGGSVTFHRTTARFGGSSTSRTDTSGAFLTRVSAGALFSLSEAVQLFAELAGFEFLFGRANATRYTVLVGALYRP